MSTIGLLGLLLAFAAIVVSVVCLVAGRLLEKHSRTSVGVSLTWGAHIAVILALCALSLCCGVLVYCFFAGDFSIDYVLRQHSDASGDLAWLYKLAGLWAGREGSLLFWAWLIGIFNTVVALRNMKEPKALDSMALLVAQIVLAAFVGVLLFSEDNMPFTATDSSYFNSDGELTSSASVLGMNTLLEHWAMAIHPPTLFIGYAGLTIPFAYAIAALIVNDPSRVWVVRSERYALVSWLFLGAGIGLGAVWAYVVLGWGGYWGWDPVENASLLSWLVSVALIHSFTVYRQRGAFKRWSVMCACISFSFVVVGTFITRSGIVESVHAFASDPVSLVFFGALIVLSILAGVIGLCVRWKSFGSAKNGTDEIEHVISRDAAYYFNNLIMILTAVLLAYLTVSSALPEVLPFGGQTVSSATYNAICRPLGILYLAILAICPLMSWGKTDMSVFLRRAKIPALCALVVFALLLAYFVLVLLPTYNTNVSYLTSLIEAGNTSAEEELATLSPAPYYLGMTVVGFFVASVLFFNMVFLLCRSFAKRRVRIPAIGGFVAHLGMAVILVGLIGSSMFVTERTGYVEYDADTDTAGNEFTIGDYRLVYASNSVTEHDNEDDVDYTVVFDAYRGDEYLGQVTPTVQLVQSTQQQKLVASVISFPLEDLFVVYRGVNENDAFSLDVRINPLISFVWVGFAFLLVGTGISAFGKRRTQPVSVRQGQSEVGDEPVDVGEQADADELVDSNVETDVVTDARRAFQIRSTDIEANADIASAAPNKKA